MCLWSNPTFLDFVFNFQDKSLQFLIVFEIPFRYDISHVTVGKKKYLPFALFDGSDAFPFMDSFAEFTFMHKPLLSDGVLF